MASKSKKSKGPEKKGSPVSTASKASKDAKSKAPVKPLPKTKPAPVPAAKSTAKAAPKAAIKLAKPAPKAVAKTPKPTSTTSGSKKPSGLAVPTAKPSVGVKAVAKTTVKAVSKAASLKSVPKGASVKTVSKVAPKVAAKPAKAAPVAAKALTNATKPAVTAKSKPTGRAAPAKAPTKTAVKAIAPALKKPAPATAKVGSANKSAPAKVVGKRVAPPVSEHAAETKVLAADLKSKGKGLKLELFKGPFFQEVVVGSPATRKNKAPQVVPSALRKPKGEESHDELIARIERELLTVRMATRKVQREQVCTKCCINPVEPGFMVDRDTGYCLECALVLGLGHTREARQQNFHPSLMKSDDDEAGGSEVAGGSDMSDGSELAGVE